jgi:hypothetical protein
MPKAQYTTSKGLVQSPGSGITVEKGTVTMSGTSATVNAPAGVVTTPGLTAIAGASEAEWTINNSFVTASSQVLIGIQYNGTVTGVPCIHVNEINTGNFKFQITNIKDAGNALDAVSQVHFLVI